MCRIWGDNVPDELWMEAMSNTIPEVRIAEIPLFPLQTVLFSGGRLPLRIYEPRYMDMISDCLKTSGGFGVVLIREGSEAFSEHQTQPEIFNIGTYAEIVDFNQLEDGLLGIIVKGGRKFRILRKFEQADHLLNGEVEFLPEEKLTVVNPDHQPLVDILKELIKHPLVSRLHINIDFSDARSVSLRLSELLPLEPEIKQSLLQMNLPRERLTELKRLVSQLS